MPTVEDLIIKMKSAPNAIRFDELRRVLENNGYMLVRQKGSHTHFRNKIGNVVTIKKENPVKAVYVKDVLRRIGGNNENRRLN